MTLAASLLLLAAVLLGWALARRSPAYAPMARALAVLLVLHAARWAATTHRAAGLPAREALRAAGLVPPAYEGAARWSWSAEQAAGWMFYVVCAWAVVVSLEAVPRAPRLKFLNFAICTFATLAAATAGFWLAYPAVRGPHVLQALTAVAVVSAVVQVTAAFWWVSQARPSPRPPIAPAHLVALLLAASAGGSVVGAYLLGDPARDWYTTPWIAALTWAAVVGVELRALRSPTPVQKGSP